MVHLSDGAVPVQRVDTPLTGSRKDAAAGGDGCTSISGESNIGDRERRVDRPQGLKPPLQVRTVPNRLREAVARRCVGGASQPGVWNLLALTDRQRCHARSGDKVRPGIGARV